MRLLVYDIIILVVGSLSFKLTGYGEYKELLVGIFVLALSLAFFAYRVVVEDKGKLTLTMPTPRTPDEERVMASSGVQH